MGLNCTQPRHPLNRKTIAIFEQQLKISNYFFNALESRKEIKQDQTLKVTFFPILCTIFELPLSNKIDPYNTQWQIFTGSSPN